MYPNRARSLHDRGKITMPSLLIVVLVLQLAIHLINTVGAQAINDLVRPLP